MIHNKWLVAGAVAATADDDDDNDDVHDWIHTNTLQNIGNVWVLYLYADSAL